MLLLMMMWMLMFLMMIAMVMVVMILVLGRELHPNNSAAKAAALILGSDLFVDPVLRLSANDPNGLKQARSCIVQARDGCHGLRVRCRADCRGAPSLLTSSLSQM